MLELHPLFPVVLIKVDHRWCYSFLGAIIWEGHHKTGICPESYQRNIPYNEELMGKRRPRFQTFEGLCHTRLTCSELGLVGGRHREEGLLFHGGSSNHETSCFEKICSVMKAQLTAPTLYTSGSTRLPVTLASQATHLSRLLLKRDHLKAKTHYSKFSLGSKLIHQREADLS